VNYRVFVRMVARETFPRSAGCVSGEKSLRNGFGVSNTVSVRTVVRELSRNLGRPYSDKGELENIFYGRAAVPVAGARVIIEVLKPNSTLTPVNYDELLSARVYEPPTLIVYYTA